MCISLHITGMITSKNIPEYIARMNQLKTDDPQTWDKFMAGDFTTSTSNQVPFTRLGVDQAQEHVNKKLRVHGAVIDAVS